MATQFHRLGSARPRVRATGRQSLETLEAKRNYVGELRTLVQSDNGREAIEDVYRQKYTALYGQRFRTHVERLKAWKRFALAAREGKDTASRDLGLYMDLAQRFPTRYGMPLASAVHTDAALTTVLAELPDQQFIADLVLPVAAVSKRSGIIYAMRDEDGRRISEKVRRAPGAKADEMGWSTKAPISYSVQNWAKSGPVPDEIAEIADDPIDVQRRTAQVIRQIVLLQIEQQGRDVVQTDTNYHADNRITTPGTKWDSDRTTSPRPELDAAFKAVPKAIGQKANVAVMNLDAAMALMDKDDFVSRVTGAVVGMPAVMLGLLAEYLMVKDAYVAFASKVTSLEGATVTFEQVWTDAVSFLYQETPGIPYRGFGFQPATDMGTVKRWREDDRETELVKYERDSDIVVVQNRAGAIIPNVLST